jgi:hypothetical protein
MAKTFKAREEHRGQPVPHLGQDHYEKSRIEAAASGDDGPSFESDEEAVVRQRPPQQPADLAYRA